MPGMQKTPKHFFKNPINVSPLNKMYKKVHCKKTCPIPNVYLYVLAKSDPFMAEQ